MDAMTVRLLRLLAEGNVNEARMKRRLGRPA
jgi:hypothetical protein